jgi:peroxiredoxin Q/BCP
VKKTLLFGLSFFFPVAISVAQTLRVGDRAPDFSLAYATRDSVAKSPLRLSDFTGRNVILAFYPADWSSGCTKEVCTLRDSFSGLQALNAEVLGISGDYVYSHHAWAKHHDLPFRLLSDHRHDVSRTYESFNEQSNYARRTVYVINTRGEIAYKDMEYSVADTLDFERLKQALRFIR